MKYLVFFCGLLCLALNLNAQTLRHALVIGNDQSIAAAVWVCHAEGIYGIKMMRKKPL